MRDFRDWTSDFDSHSGPFDQVATAKKYVKLIFFKQGLHSKDIVQQLKKGTKINLI